jgi:UDP-N-acetylglucosamine 2-epimerase (non-hydrolysing)
MASPLIHLIVGAMSDVFLDELGLPKPHHSLGVGPGSHAEQTAAIMVAYERVLLTECPEWVIVVGDVNSTLAATLAAKKLTFKVAHLEAGLRSFDRSMPEEINRIVTDALADLLWTPSPDGDENLLREGVTPDRIERVGNIMIDTFEMMRAKIEILSPVSKADLKKEFAVVTLHRPANVDDPVRLNALVDSLLHIADSIPIIFPLHPRTKARLQALSRIGQLENHPAITLIGPLGYTEFMSFVIRARLVITDSGGVQEETTYLGIPCLTVRPNTERPITVTAGTNRLVTEGTLVESVRSTLGGSKGQMAPLPQWDGRTSERVAASLRRRLAN